ncbi:Tyrosine-specific transport protein 2 [Morella rubra]|nr:Tyrosine-specific transport protein 2 [Morella rubra]
MAQETLGDLGGTLATVIYVFLGYTSMIAYSSKSGEILFHLLNLPASISGFFFTALFTMLISLGGTRATAQITGQPHILMDANNALELNSGLLLAIEVLAVVYGGWAGSAGSGDWGKIPATIPVMIFSLVYHDLAPVLCAYLGGDLSRIRTSVLLGSLVPLLALLVWDAVALGLSTEADHVVDPVELLMRVQWSGVSLMVEAFSLLAVGTSLIGTLLGFSEFFKEQFLNISWQSPPIQNVKILNKFYGQRKWWGRNKITFAAMAMAVTPSLFVSTAFPDACSAAIDIAGGYCMTMLYGVLPPAMAWAMLDRNSEDTEQKAFSNARPMLLGVGLFACGIVMEQILQDIPLLAR